MIYDAIVIGSGITGGLAAKELCEKGFKTLLLERGRDVKHITGYTTAMMAPWEFPNRLTITNEDRERNPVQSNKYDEGCKQFFVDDQKHPYVQDSPFWWVRGYQVGGRSLTWGRQCYRWSDLDFEANIKDGHGVDWPIRYKDIQPWYDYVEKYIGISGNKENLPQLPDGAFQPPMALNCIEEYLDESIRKNFPDRLITIARVANLTREHSHRGPCKNRNLCNRGCPFGAYFSSNSTTIPDAFATGNLTLRPHSIISEIIYDENTQRAKSVIVIDAIDHKTYEFKAKLIFLNASTIASAAILLNSKSNRFPDGLGNDSGALGHNLMDHHCSAGATAVYDGFTDKYYKGRRPCGFLIPRYRNLNNELNGNFIRGYNIQGTGERMGWQEKKGQLKQLGEHYKNNLITPGPWTVWLGGFGECLPYHENKMYLSKFKTDEWGQPIVHIDFSFRVNENKMMLDIQKTSGEMLSRAGFTDVDEFNYHKPGGAGIHEMGTARMGNDPRSSVLNGFNQIHSVKNIFVTDGSCMASSACQNPSLTYMALTARACQFAFEQMKNGEL